jgi:hypothetical protein
MASAQFHHYGVPTTAKGAEENYIAGAGVYITDPEKHPFRVEFLRFDADSAMHEDVRTRPHAAFLVPCLDEALKGCNVIIPPFDATDELRCAFVRDGEALIEVMEKR